MAKYGQKIEVYLGGENLSDYRQERAILSFENPLDEYFDSSMIWGPIQGRMIYVGLRMKLLE